MPVSDSSYTVTAEKADFRTLGVLYEQASRKLSAMFEESAEASGSWIATSGLSHWQTGEPVTDEEQRAVIAHLNDWGRSRGWRFDVGVMLPDVRLEDVAPGQRGFIRTLQEAARRQEQQRRKV